MAIARKQFEFPNADFAMSLIKLDRMIETTNDIISKEAEKEGTDDKITRLTSRSADYQLQKEALIAKGSQELVPQIVPEEFLNIPANIVLNYESNCVTVEYDEDTLAEYLASKDDDEDEKEAPVEEAAEESEDQEDVEE